MSDAQDIQASDVRTTLSRYDAAALQLDTHVTVEEVIDRLCSEISELKKRVENLEFRHVDR